MRASCQTQAVQKNEFHPHGAKRQTSAKSKCLQGESAARAASVYLHCTSSAFSEKETKKWYVKMCVHSFIDNRKRKGYKKNWLYSCMEIQ